LNVRVKQACSLFKFQKITESLNRNGIWMGKFKTANYSGTGLL